MLEFVASTMPKITFLLGSKVVHYGQNYMEMHQLSNTRLILILKIGSFNIFKFQLILMFEVVATIMAKLPFLQYKKKAPWIMNKVLFFSVADLGLSFYRQKIDLCRLKIYQLKIYFTKNILYQMNVHLKWKHLNKVCSKFIRYMLPKRYHWNRFDSFSSVIFQTAFLNYVFHAILLTSHTFVSTVQKFRKLK